MLLHVLIDYLNINNLYNYIIHRCKIYRACNRFKETEKKEKKFITNN